MAESVSNFLHAFITTTSLNAAMIKQNSPGSQPMCSGLVMMHPGYSATTKCPTGKAWMSALPSYLHAKLEPMSQPMARLTCLRCGHQWTPHKNPHPDRCASPRCRTPYWNQPRQATDALSARPLTQTDQLETHQRLRDYLNHAHNCPDCRLDLYEHNIRVITEALKSLSPEATKELLRTKIQQSMHS